MQRPKSAALRGSPTRRRRDDSRVTATATRGGLPTARGSRQRSMTIVFPEWVEPMAATLTQERFTGPEWIFERKFDGIRLLAFKHGADVRLFSRNRLPQHHSGGRRGDRGSLPVRDADPRRRSHAGSEGRSRVPRLRHPVARRPRRHRAAARRAPRAVGLRCRCRSPLERVRRLDDPQAVGARVPRGLGGRDREAARLAATSTAARRTG